MRSMVFGVTLLLFGLILTIAYTGNGPACFAFLNYIPGHDKTGHVALLFLLTSAISWALLLRGIRMQRLKIYYGVCAVFLFITAEEFIQIFSPHRTFDLLDLSCNYLGILVAWAGLSLYEKRKTRAAQTE